MNNQVKVLPSSQPKELPTTNVITPLETLFDMAKKERQRSNSVNQNHKQEPQFMLNASNAIVNRSNKEHVVENIKISPMHDKTIIPSILIFLY